MFTCCCRYTEGKYTKYNGKTCLINQGQQRRSEIVYFSGLREIHAQIISNGPFPTFSKNKTILISKDRLIFTYRFGSVLDFFFVGGEGGNGGTTNVWLLASIKM